MGCPKLRYKSKINLNLNSNSNLKLNRKRKRKRKKKEGHSPIGLASAKRPISSLSLWPRRTGPPQQRQIKRKKIKGPSPYAGPGPRPSSPLLAKGDIPFSEPR